MHLDIGDISLSGFEPTSKLCEQYEDSITSSAPSSQSSVFSESLSVQSSAASSVSDDFRNGQEDARERDRVCAQAQLRYQAKHSLLPQQEPSGIQSVFGGSCRSYADITSVPAPERQQHRQRAPNKCQKPLHLNRQRDRKINFVDNLVDSASQMVEVIWPLSVVPCKSEGSSRGVLPLRTYIEETLRRSRTSYSTLQVALYYLLLIRPHVPRSDFTVELKSDCPGDRALMCGRRMFLAALILASKYLQDRNYSAKAWSKMSGLKVCEINLNERIFLSKINWKLHIPKPTFEKWQEVVLRFTPYPPPSLSAEMSMVTSTWKRIVPVLTPELDIISTAGDISVSNESSIESALPAPSSTNSSKSYLLQTVVSKNSSQESTPTPRTCLPPFLEPQPDLRPPTPALARLGPLPTPSMTPSSIAPSTPAASACGSRRSSMCLATAPSSTTGRIDSSPASCKHRPILSRRCSNMSVCSLGSSPESMVTDHARSSRSSSIASSVGRTSLSYTAPRPSLARQATCRNAGSAPLKLVQEETEGSVVRPIIIDDDIEMAQSPQMADFTHSTRVLHAPHRHSKASKHTPHSSQVHSYGERSKKRSRTHGQRRLDLQDEVRWQLEESMEDDMDLDVADDVASPSAATICATNMLASSLDQMQTKEGQPPDMHSYRQSTWLPVQKHNGRKRTCCSTRVSPSVPFRTSIAKSVF